MQEELRHTTQVSWNPKVAHRHRTKKTESHICVNSVSFSSRVSYIKYDEINKGISFRIFTILDLLVILNLQLYI